MAGSVAGDRERDGEPDEWEKKKKQKENRGE